MESAIVRDLGAWYDAVARDLPWRRTREPYAIWVSEIMLQQTRVETVIPYFERFVRRYPDVGALARASLDDVLAQWSGLGYYRRARIMHAAAREVAERRGGVFPDQVESLLELPGIGRYTAGAVASIAFERRAPLVDGNVARVLARLYAIEEDVKGATGQKELWAMAERLVPADRPGRFNQALMELGATVCLPRAPRCDACPLRAACVAAATGRTAALPVVGRPRARPKIAMVAAVVRHERAVLLARRSEGGLFGGLWEPPMVEAKTLRSAHARLEGAGARVPLGSLERAGRVRHVLTHRELDVLVVRAEVARRSRALRPTTAPYEQAAWIDVDVAEIGISTLARKILRRASS